MNLQQDPINADAIDFRLAKGLVYDFISEYSTTGILVT